MGSTQTGLSIFWPDDGLDEGPIFLQKTCEIGPDETLGDVYFKKLFPMGVDAMIECLDLVKAGVILKHTQDLEAGSYESWFNKKVAQLDWSKPNSEVYNWIRAANPQPGAWTTVNGTKLAIFDSAKTAGHGQPGEVIAISDEGITVAAGDGAILAKKVRPDKDAKVAASEWAAASGLKVGDVCVRVEE
jgi:methionyl-tRNA formyltransferase